MSILQQGYSPWVSFLAQTWYSYHGAALTGIVAIKLAQICTLNEDIRIIMPFPCMPMPEYVGCVSEDAFMIYACIQ